MSKKLLTVHLAVLLFGAAALFGRLPGVSAFHVVLGRVVFASVALFVFCVFSGISLNIRKKSQLLLLMLSGALLAFHWLAFFKAVQLSQIALALLCFSTFPLFTAFTEPLLLKEKFRWQFVWPSLLALAGVLIMYSDNIDLQGGVQAVFWGLLSGASFAVISVINRKLSFELHAIKLSFYMNVFASLCLFPFAFFIPFLWSIHSILMLLLLGVVFTALAHSLFIYGMKDLGARTASLIAALEPVYGIILAIFILNEVPEIKTIAGGLLIIMAVFIRLKF